MERCGIKVNIKNVPELDKQFIPMSLFTKAFLQNAKKPISICVQRNDQLCSVYDTYITGENKEADFLYVERTVKNLLWLKGGYRVIICGDEEIAARIKEAYSKKGIRSFDNEFFTSLYEQEFEVVSKPLSEKPSQNEAPMSVGGSLSGCRIGFDAGGSDYKVSAVIDGEVVYGEEIVWNPKVMSDPDYHYDKIVGALKAAASKMPRVDSIGISSAGIYVNNRTMVASLFLKVPKDDFEAKVKDIYIRAAKEIGDVPLVVVNDGDVVALAGAAALSDNGVLGIAMGTSQAGGFVDENGRITGWLNELAFAPVDASEHAAQDEWSGDIGCGVKYFSQDAVIKLAKNVGIELDENLTPGEKLKIVQGMLEKNAPEARKIFTSIGCYLGHALPYYHEFYKFKHVLLLGRVMSGEGGNIIAEAAKRVIEDEYPESKFNIHVPDEKSRRLGQSVTAASIV